MADGKFESWAIVELFGHQQIAGLVTEATIGGCSFVRVDVPETDGRPAFTKFYGNSAIYSMTLVGEAEARLALERIMPKPVSVYLLPEPRSVVERRIPAASARSYDVSEQDDDDPDDYHISSAYLFEIDNPDFDGEPESDEMAGSEAEIEF